MKDVIYLLLHLLITIAKLLRLGGNKTIIAENLLLKQQLIIHNRETSQMLAKFSGSVESKNIAVPAHKGIGMQAIQ